MIKPQEIDLESLPSVLLKDKDDLPRFAGIYFAIDDKDKIQYIGCTKNIKRRWSRHQRYAELEKLGNVKIAYLLVDSFDLLPRIESALIHWFNPPLNSSFVREEQDRKRVGNIEIRIKEVRKKRGLSQTKLAQLLNMSPQNYQQIENASKKSVNKETLNNLCKILDCAVGDLIVYVGR